MTTEHVKDLLPDIARPDVGIVAVSEWEVGTAERQQKLFEASTAAWEAIRWPETLLSINWLASLDGERALAYVQWANDTQFEEFRTTVRPALFARIQEALPDIQPSPARFYRLHRSRVRPDATPPGCIVIVRVEFEAPEETRQKAWIDTVFQALDAEENLHPGGLAAHFHVSADGAGVLNWAEWTDAAAHQEALDGSKQGTIGSNPLWQRVLTFPGMTAHGFRRYRFARSLSRARREHAA
ncbi:MAG TPA: hypothetical protein VIL35_04900 [Vicinamibacterales bacterium]